MVAALAIFGLCLIAAGVVDRALLERIAVRRRGRARERELLRKLDAIKERGTPRAR